MLSVGPIVKEKTSNLIGALGSVHFVCFLMTLAVAKVMWVVLMTEYAWSTARGI
jgi:hypothetical protein